VASTTDGKLWILTDYTVKGADQNYHVSGTATYADVKEEGNSFDVTTNSEVMDFGQLRSIVFENGAIYLSGGHLVVVVYHLSDVSSAYVSALRMETNGDTLLPQLTATPDAPADVKKEIDRMNRLIKEIGGFQTIVAQDGAVAIVDTPHGKVLRIYDRNAVANIPANPITAVLNLLKGTAEYNHLETLNGQVVFDRHPDGTVTVTYPGPNGPVTEKILSYRATANGIIIRTPSGEHRIQLVAPPRGATVVVDGTPVGAPDVQSGEDPTAVLNDVLSGNGDHNVFSAGGGKIALIRRPDGTLIIRYIDPTTGQVVTETVERIEKRPDGSIVVQTPSGTHVIAVQPSAVSSGGQVAVDGAPHGTLPANSNEELLALLQQMLAGSGPQQISSSDGSVAFVRTPDGQVVMNVDGKTEKVENVERTEDGSVVVRTDSGEHKVSVSPPSSPTAASAVAFDGNVMGPLATSGAVEEHNIISMTQSPTDPHTIIVKTESGDMNISVKTDSDGNPYLAVNDVLKGMVQFMQGAKGALAYDPQTGTYSLIAGLLTPLAEAFKSGLHISVDSSGNVSATPYNYAFTMRPVNPYSQSPQGISLPLMDDLGVALLVMALAAIYVLMK
jgi:hypothetical protein